MFNNPFDDPRLDKYRVQDQEDEEYGVYLKFNCIKNKNIKTCFAFWSDNDRATFEDVGGNTDPSQNSGRKNIINPNSKEVFLLIDQLLKYHGYVNIIVEPHNMTVYPEEFKILEKVLNEHYMGNENIYIEFPRDTTRPSRKISKPTGPAPTLMSKTDIFDLQKQIMSGIRTTSGLNDKFIGADPTMRNKALDIGVKSLQRGYTLSDALDEVEGVLDGSINEEYIDEFAKSSRSLDRDDDDGDSTVIDRPSDDVKDLSSARDQLLRIMKLAGQSGEGEKPAGWNLVLYDDPVTPGSAVIDGLRSVMNMNRAQIERVINECTRGGRSVLATYAIEDKALSMRDRLKSAIDNNSNYLGGNGTYGPWDVNLDVTKG